MSARTKIALLIAAHLVAIPVLAWKPEEEEMKYAVNVRYAKECYFVIETDDELTEEQVWKKLETCNYEMIEDSLAEWELATEFLQVLELTPTEDEADVRLDVHMDGPECRYDELYLVKDDGYRKDGQK